MYESNGPDVKIRGTASHVAEKYLQLARDAQSSGDPIAAENYYQHAEHYFRLIAAAQEQLRKPSPTISSSSRNKAKRAVISDDGYDDGEDEQPLIGGEPFAPREPQPYYPREQQQQQQHSNISSSRSISSRNATTAANSSSRSTFSRVRSISSRPMTRTSSGCRHSSPAARRHSHRAAAEATGERPRPNGQNGRNGYDGAGRPLSAASPAPAPSRPARPSMPG